MIKNLYLGLLKFRPARLLLRRCRARAQAVCGYSDPFFDLVRIARASRASLFIDIGCHKGDTLLRFLESGIKCRVAAFDPFAESLEQARRLLGRARSELEFVRPGALLESLEPRLAGLQATCRDVGEALAAQYFRPTLWVEWSDAGRTGEFAIEDGSELEGR